LGRTYNEIAGEARSMHKCQGMSQLLPLPAPTGGGGFGPGGVRNYRLRDTVLDGGVARGEKEIFDGVDTSLRSLLRFAGANAPADLGTRLDAIAASVAEARKALAAGGSVAAIAPLGRGLRVVRDVRAGLGSLSEQARYEIDLRLAQKEDQFEQALMLAADVRIEAIARDGLVPPGAPVTVDAMAATRSTATVTTEVTLNGFSAPASGMPCQANTAKPAGPGRFSCSGPVIVPADARLTAAHFHMPSAEAKASALQPSRYVFDADVPFGLPFRPTPFTATFTLTIEGTTVTQTIPFQARSEGNIFSGEKRAEIHVVPAFAVSATPEIIVVSTSPDAAPGGARDVRVTVTITRAARRKPMSRWSCRKAGARRRRRSR
jgi:hypothetical protein